MDSFEFNKLIGALLATVFVVFSIGLISDGIFAAPSPDKPGYIIEAVEEEAPAAGAAEATSESVLPLLASASVDNGAAIFKKCGACHIDDQSGANKVGPNLWGVVGRPIAAHEGFSYSAAIKEFSKGNSVHWTYENLDHFLTSPKGLIKGTAMGFAGLKKVQERADVIAYLRTKAETPAPLPDPAAAPAAENAAAPADGTAAPADAAKPADGTAAPADATKPADGTAVPADAAKPADGTSAPADAAKPADGTPAPAEPAKPADGTPAPAESAKPANGAADPAKPADTAAPSAAPAQ